MPASISTANGRLRPPLSRLNRCVIWPSVKRSTIWWDYKPAGAPAFNRVRDLVSEGYVGDVLSCTMIITTAAWGAEFPLDWAYMADRSNGNTLLTSPGGHAIDALCYCLGEFKELASVVANQRQRVKIVETGEMIQMTSPDQVLISGVLQSGAVASVHLKGGTANGTGFLFEIHGTEGDLAVVPADPRQAPYIQGSEFTVPGAPAGQPRAELSMPESYRWVPPAVPAGGSFHLWPPFLGAAG